MALSEQDLAQIEAFAAALTEGRRSPADFRREFIGLTLTRCAAGDMNGAEPFRRGARFDLHLVDGRDHCWQLTRDPAVATGVVIAQREEPT